MDGNKARGVQFVADRILNPPAAAGRGGGRGGPPLTPEEQSSLERGGVIYNELCFSCHGDDGRGTPTPGAAAGSTLAPSLVGSARVNGHRDYVIKTLLHGLTGPIDGKIYPQVMVAMGSNKDQWIADITSYVRNSFGNTGTFVTTARRREGARRQRRSEDAVDRRGAGRARCRASSSRMRRGKSRPATTSGRRRRRTPRVASTSSATPQARSTSSAGRPACRSRPACGSRSSCPSRSR